MLELCNWGYIRVRFVLYCLVSIRVSGAIGAGFPFLVPSGIHDKCLLGENKSRARRQGMAATA